MASHLVCHGSGGVLSTTSNRLAASAMMSGRVLLSAVGMVACSANALCRSAQQAAQRRRRGARLTVQVSEGWQQACHSEMSSHDPANVHQIHTSGCTIPASFLSMLLALMLCLGAGAGTWLSPKGTWSATELQEKSLLLTDNSSNACIKVAGPGGARSTAF